MEHKQNQKMLGPCKSQSICHICLIFDPCIFSVVSFLKFYYILEIYIFRISKQQREKQTSSIYHFTFPVTTVAIVGWDWSWELHIVSPRGGRSSDTCAIFHCFSLAIGGGLKQKWRDWDTNSCPYGMLALQVALLPTMPQCWPLLNHIEFKACWSLVKSIFFMQF